MVLGVSEAKVRITVKDRKGIPVIVDIVKSGKSGATDAIRREKQTVEGAAWS